MVSVRRVVVPVLLLVTAIPLFGAAKKSSSNPPRDLHRAGDHWTAYNPPDPATWPAGSRTYTIKAGDTLWGLAQQFFKNAYTWPQLWETNTWITDAHWIYPGDVLLIDAETAKQIEATNAASNEPGPPALVTDTS
ncbi:MAG: LysM peptidoglycan-binding domain-containing protein, partial [Thermoanaerobaculia bacterium]